jgi:hypothetical protein
MCNRDISDLIKDAALILVELRDDVVDPLLHPCGVIPHLLSYDGRGHCHGWRLRQHGVI